MRGERGSEAERKRKFLESLDQEEWTPLLLSLTAGNAGEQRERDRERERETDACYPLIDTNQY